MKISLLLLGALFIVLVGCDDGPIKQLYQECSSEEDCGGGFCADEPESPSGQACSDNCVVSKTDIADGYYEVSNCGSGCCLNYTGTDGFCVPCANYFDSAGNIAGCGGRTGGCTPIPDASDSEGSSCKGTILTTCVDCECSAGKHATCTAYPLGDTSSKERCCTCS